MATPQTARLSDDELGRLFNLLQDADTVELKLTVPESDRGSTVEALKIDPLDASIRQVYFFDTPGLDLFDQGVVVRARRTQGKPDDSVIKLRPVIPNELSEDLRDQEGFGVEVDAMPGGFVCSASYKGSIPAGRVRDAMEGTEPLHKLFSKKQRAFFSEQTSAAVDMNSLSILGPVMVFKLKFFPEGFKRRIVVEQWNYPDGSRILELSTKCLPSEAFQVAAETKVFLNERGVNVSAEQSTKTRTALDFFAAALRENQGP